MNRREWHVPGIPASAGGSATRTAKSLPAFAAALHERLDVAGERVRQECSHLDHVEAVASEYLLAAKPPRTCS